MCLSCIHSIFFLLNIILRGFSLVLCGSRKKLPGHAWVVCSFIYFRILEYWNVCWKDTVCLFALESVNKLSWLLSFYSSFGPWEHLFDWSSYFWPLRIWYEDKSRKALFRIVILGYWIFVINAFTTKSYEA